jgi:peptidoglycan/xylan/chitin deacetylase (PgdA/CDA1 family)
VQGVVTKVKHEADGDAHINVAVDPASQKTAGVKPSLVTEAVCKWKPTGGPAIAICGSYRSPVKVPKVGQHIEVTGPYVLDSNHNFYEIHPINSLKVIDDPPPTTTTTTQPPTTTRPHARPAVSAPAPARGTVWLTFDDGPNPGETQAILQTLAQYRVRATFFVVGKRAQRYPGLVAEEQAAGMVIGNHTYDHPLTLIDMTYGQMAREIDNGVSSHWFRPPGGFVNQTLREIVAARGMRIVLWDVDPQDWSRPGADVITARVLSHAKPWWSRPWNPDVVVVLHDGGGDRWQTVRALPRIIEEFRREGFRFEAL